MAALQKPCSTLLFIRAKQTIVQESLRHLKSNNPLLAGRPSMRFLVKVSMPVEAGNAAAKAGKLGATIQSILADLKPEAVYFTDDNGRRTAFIFIEMQNASQIPAIAEPWFLAFNASIEFHPVMVPDDLAKAGSAIEAAVNKYG